MGQDFIKFDGYYFFDAQLKHLENYDFPNKKAIWFGRLDVKTSSLELIEVDTWKVVKSLELVPYKETVFLIKGYENLFLHLESSSSMTGQHSLRFISNRDKLNSFLTSGYYVFELRSIDHCKRFLQNWEEEVKRTNCNKEECYGY